jgi:membrane associated rhomboid family serine protease
MDSYQFYRYVTSEFSHGSLTHIISNMLILLVYGWEIESTYGTLFYAALHFMLMVLSNTLNLVIVWFLVFVWPISLGGGPYHL